MAIAAQQGNEFEGRYINVFERRGMAAGEARGEARALLAILDVRNIHVPDEVRAEIVTCVDTAQLEAWIRRAATADKIQDVLGKI
jgi:hypothetical protein